MRLPFRFIITAVANAIALLLLSVYLPDISLLPDPLAITILSATLAAINLIIRPIFRLLLSPIIFITLGAARFALNAAILYALDFVSDTLTINSIRELLIATVVIWLINSVLVSSARLSYPRS